VLTDAELDARLAGAAGVRDADLPALPETFLARLRAGTDAEPASVVAARQLVTDAEEARTAPPRRRPPVRRAVVLRVGAAVLTVAAAWTTAVVVTSDGDRPPSAAPEPSPSPSPTPSAADPTNGPIDPPGGLTLVAAEAVSFPYSLDPVPADLTPELARFGGLEMFGEVSPVTWRATYRSADDPGFTFVVSAEDPRVLPAGATEGPEAAVVESSTVDVDGAAADLVQGDYDEPHCGYGPASPDQADPPDELCAASFAELTWHRPDGLWVQVRGEDRWSSAAAVVSVAESVVDRPQPAALQVGLAPDGWLVSGYETGSLTLSDPADPTDPSERIGVSVLERWRGYADPGDVLQGMTDGDPVEQVTVHGLPAELVSVPDHFADLSEGRRMWYLAARFADGPLFLLQAPDTLTRDDVLAVAERVTWTP
jgi:hypothetical protein